jgi:hypothetical protein
VTAAGWLLVGILLGVVLTVLLVEWHDGHQRRQRRHRTRSGDHPAGVDARAAQRVQQDTHWSNPDLG